jgi:serine protease Do
VGQVFKGWSFPLLLVGLQIWAGAIGYAHAQGNLGIDERIGSSEGWAIGYNKSVNGCLASETYSDETTFWLGIDGRDHTFFLALTNPNWQSIEPGKAYALKFLALGGGRWQGKFVGVSRESEKGVVSGELNEKFVGDIVRSAGVAVSIGDRTVARLNLQGSSAAMSAIVQCQGEKGGGAGSPSRSGGTSQGTGFFITSNGHILTNAHVVKGCTTVDLQQPGGVVHSGRVMATDGQNDLAVIITDMKPPAVAAFRTDVRLGENIAVFGFPLGDRLSTSGNFTVGYVSALAGMKDNSSEIQISAPIQPGSSGGPVFDNHGNVVAVIVATATTAIMANTSGETPSVMPQNINFAIKTAIALAFLNSNAVNPDAQIDTKSSLDTAEIAERAKARTVKIMCRH